MTDSSIYQPITDSLSEELRRELRTEYWKLADMVTGFDQRLLTVKGWGVTLSLAALGWGFEKSHYGLFLVAALSSAGFWLIEGVYKRHQMRIYVRMRDIEVTLWRRAGEPDSDTTKVSSPLNDWAWKTAGRVLTKGAAARDWLPTPYDRKWSYGRTWFYAAVAFPHVIAIVAGTVLFLLGLRGKLDGMRL
jgi:hypothetical protein